MQPAGVVPAFDVVEDSPVQACAGGPGAAVDELALDGGEEALSNGVIPAFSFSGYRQDDAVRAGQGGEVPAGVLWQPRSLWKMTPPAGRRVVNAIVRASWTSS